MPMSRKNSSNNEQKQPAPGKFQGQMEDRWFAANRKRQLRRKELALLMKRRQRRALKNK